MIEVRGLNLAAGKFRIEDLSLHLAGGVFNILLGPTGSGKTLLLESIMGLRKIQSGQIFMGGTEIQQLPPEKRGIGYVPQDLALFPHLTVQENLTFGLDVSGKRAEGDPRHFEVLVEALKIRHLLARYPQSLSGGEKQRVALGRSLAPTPKILLLDEPLAALDPGLKNEILQLLITLQQSLKFTAFYVTHDLDEAYLLGEKVIILINGKVEQSGTREDIFLRPGTIQVAQFLGFRNLFTARVAKVEKGDGSVTLNLWEREIILPEDHALRDLSPGEEVILYLRPEEVLILREGKPIKDSLRQSILHGEILSIRDRGTYRWILFRPQGLEIFLEIHLPNYVFRNLGLQEGKGIQVAMRRESFWVIPGRSRTEQERRRSAIDRRSTADL